jgi:hypothetical protein
MTGPVRAIACIGLLAAVGLAIPQARADDDCAVPLGRGWPPATENYGTAVEQLLVDDAGPVLALTRLPSRGTESALVLIAANEGDWTLRFAEADKRVLDWSGGTDLKRELRTGQTPERTDVPMPAPLARRLVDMWQRALSSAVPADRPAAYSDDDTWLFVFGDPVSNAEPALRISGQMPECGVTEYLSEQVGLLVEATDDRDSRRVRRWDQLEASLDDMDRTMTADVAGR